MARPPAAIAVFPLLCFLFLLSRAADTTTAEASKREATTQVLPTAVSTAPLTKEALEASFIPVSVDKIHIDGPLREIKGGGAVHEVRRPFHVRFFHTHHPLRLKIRGRSADVVPPEWLGGRRLGAGFRFHHGHRPKCEILKRMMMLKGKDDGSPMLHHRHHPHPHHHLHVLRHEHRRDDQGKKAGGGLAKWLRGFFEQF